MLDQVPEYRLNQPKEERVFSNLAATLRNRMGRVFGLPDDELQGEAALAERRKKLESISPELRVLHPRQGFHTIPPDYVGDFVMVESMDANGNAISPPFHCINEREARAYLQLEIANGFRGEARIATCRRTPKDNPGSYSVTGVIGSVEIPMEGAALETNSGPMPQTKEFGLQKNRSK